MASSASSLLSLARSLSSLSPSAPLNSLVVGGTSGIGAGCAIALSKHANKDSRVIIAGRRQAAAQDIIEQAKAEGAVGSLEFQKVDASLMRNVETFSQSLADSLKSQGGKQLDVLVLSQGILSLSRSDTSEGIDTMLAVGYYSRMYLIRRLTTLGVLSPTCLVIHVLNGRNGDSTGTTIDFEDLGMRKLGIMKFFKQVMSMSDVMIQDFGLQQSAGARMVFVHDYSGAVKTDILNSPILRIIFYISSFFRVAPMSIIEAGDCIVRGAIACWLRTNGADATVTEGEKSYWFIDQNGLEIVKEPASEEVRRQVREHTWALAEGAASRGVGV